MTASTERSRSGSMSSGGTRYGMFASRIFRFARTKRGAIVGSGTKNARAISGVVRPPSVRSVSATRASIASAGWQHVKINRSRSSGMMLMSSLSMLSSSVKRASCCCLSASTFSRRILSIALLRAVAISHAVGFDGMPPSHFSSAIANASCTTSSARSKSRSTRIIVAVTRPETSRKTRSTSVRVVAMRQAYATRLGVLPARLLVDHLHDLGCDRPDLDGAVSRDGDLGRSSERLVQVVQLEQEEPGQDLLGLGERSVGRDRLPVPDPDGRGVLGQLQRRASADLVGDGCDELAELAGVFALRLGVGRELLGILVDQQRVEHGSSLWTRAQ